MPNLTQANANFTNALLIFDLQPESPDPLDIADIYPTSELGQIASEWENFNSRYISCPAKAIHGGMAGATLSAPPVTIGTKDKGKDTETKNPPPAPTGNWSPSLQNVLDQPASAFPLKMMLSGLLFCIAFISWAMLGSIDEVGRAQGRLVPQGEVYKVNPVDLGKIAKVAVKEGQEVKRGDVLVELDTQLAANTVKGLAQQLSGYETQLAQRQDLLTKMHLEANTQAAIARTELQAQTAVLAQAREKAATARKMLSSLQIDANAYATRRDRLQPLANTSAILLKQLQVDLEASQQRVERLKPLVEVGAIAKEQMFQAEQAVRERQRAIVETQLQQTTSTREQIFAAEQAWRERQQSIVQTKSELTLAIAEAQRAQVGLAQKQAEAHAVQLKAQQQIQGMELELTALKTKIAETKNLLQSAQEKLNQRYLYAPTDGVVSSLNVHNPGEVVQAGQPVAEVAPENAPLVLLAKLPNNQAGTVKVGMSVKIKLDAYPYQDYGIVEGKVTAISPDTKQDQQLGAVYQVEVALNRNFTSVNNQKLKFKAGQTGTADIITRQRRIADLLLDPLKQIQQGGLDM